MAVKDKVVLVADDTDDTRFMLKRMLTMNGCEVIEASNGQDAVEIAERECPAVVLLDLSMPQMDGLEAVKQIRECKDIGEEVLIIAMTAYDTHGMKEAAIEAGCHEYINKPNELDYMEKVLRRYLGDPT